MSSNIENARVSDIVSNEHVSDGMNEQLNEHMSSSNELNKWEPLTDFEDDYEIEIEPPHMIRRRSNGWIVTTTLNNLSGYYQVRLNGKTYHYHRILAKHFIPNPNGLPEVDHKNRDKANNSLDNLRWVTRSQNNINRTVKKYGKREFLDHAPNDIIEIRTFNDFEYPAGKYFFCGENDQVVQRVDDHRWRYLNMTTNKGYLRINMRDINGRNHQICVHKLIQHFRNETAADENVNE